MNSDSKEISITGLSKDLGLPTNSVFQDFSELGYIVRNTEKDTWELTKSGLGIGGIYKVGPYGKYIAWPESIRTEYQTWLNKNPKHELITASTIGKHYQMTADRINQILSELGYITKDLRELNKGWHITKLGLTIGGIESRHTTSGASFVRWPSNLINNPILKNGIKESQGDVSPHSMNVSQNDESVGFREKFKAEHRAKDGHMVRSKSEIIIDNWLYDAKIVHAYERKLPVEEDVYCDFYIPTQKVYLEYWGLDDAQYTGRKLEKQKIYAKYNFNLIELSDKDVINLDDVLPAKLLSYGIPTEN
ncbi:MAG: glycerol kinase [Dehalogenimonas sp.]